MDVQAYISSGILELYCAGALTERENREVEANAKQFPKIRSEIEAIQKSLDSYAALHSANPNPALKDKILNSLEDKGPGAGSTKSGSGNLVRNFLALGLVLACILVIIGYNKLEKATGSLDLTKRKLAETKLAKENVDKQLVGCHEQMTYLIHKDTKTVPLSGLPLSPSSKVIVYWNATNQITYLNVADLPTAPPGKQYQLWALSGGKPIDAGVFDSEKHILQPMKTIANAQAFAVTLENAGGSLTPTMNQMYAIGSI